MDRRPVFYPTSFLSTLPIRTSFLKLIRVQPLKDKGTELIGQGVQLDKPMVATLSGTTFMYKGCNMVITTRNFNRVISCYVLKKGLI